MRKPIPFLNLFSRKGCLRHNLWSKLSAQAFDADGAAKVVWKATNEDEPGNILAYNTANGTI